MNIMKRSIVILAICIASAYGLFEDQAFRFDWRQQKIGPVEDLEFYTASKSRDILLVRTSENVLAGLDGDSGKLIWRQVLGEAEQVLDITLDGKYLKSLSYDPKENSSFLRAWNVQNGALSTEERVSIQLEYEVNQGFLHNNVGHLVHFTEHNGLKVHPVFDKLLDKSVFSFSTGATEDKNGFSCTTLTDSLVCISTLLSMVYSTKLPLSGNTMSAAHLEALGLQEKPIEQKIKPLTGDQIQLTLKSGSVALLTFKAGKFNAINTIKSKDSKIMHLTSCPQDKEYIYLGQTCKDLQHCQSSLSLLKGGNENLYETTGARGLVTNTWALCDKDDKDAYQLIVKSEDGSLVSVTPLGNIMWQREEALAAITTVKLIDNDRFDDDGTFSDEHVNEQHVLEMFLKRVKHHGSQLHMLLQKIKIGKVGLGSLLLGDPDSSYDDFGMRKVIVALTKSGSLYGLDNKSGKTLWQIMTYCKEESSIYLQRDTTHFGFDPIASLVCKANSNRLIKFNPLNGNVLEEPLEVKGQIQRSILLHHATEDHIRPILLLTEGQNHVLEPKTAGKSLQHISGKMFVANIDANNEGIHGHRITVNDDGSLAMVPVWSFTSAGAKIMHLLPKPTEEIVHSQGRVMADRSVLFKYINPNLAFVMAEGQDASSKSFVNLYLLDLVTGRVIFSANHKRVQGPYHVVHSENWVVYTYYNEKSRRAELGSLELFEGKTQSNATVFSSLHSTISPLVERQSYILGKSLNIS